MKTIRTNLPPAILIMLIPIVIIFLTIAIPILVFAAFLSGVSYLVTGRSPLEAYLRSRANGRSSAGGVPFEQKPRQDAPRRASDDDTIECEVISARTFDENGQEIR